MKIKLYSLALSTFMAGILVTSCQSNSEKEEAAQAKVDEAATELKDAKQEQTAVVQTLANAEEWAAYRADIEVKIKANEVKIAEIRLKLKKPGTVLDPLYKDRIDALETRNNNLRIKMNDYERSQSDWETFKREFKSDMDGLGAALEDLSKDNKK